MVVTNITSDADCACGHAGAVRKGAWDAHDAVLEMLNLHDQGRGKLGGGSNDSSAAGFVNDTGTTKTGYEAGRLNLQLVALSLT